MKKTRRRARTNPKDDKFSYGYKPYKPSYDYGYYPRYGYYQPYYHDYYYGPPRPVSTTSLVIGGVIVLAALAVVALTPTKSDYGSLPPPSY